MRSNIAREVRRVLGLVFCAAVGAASAQAVDDGAELAKKLSNPIANLISVPFKLSWDTGYGTADSDRTTLFVQPVIPVSMNQDINVIIRTIVPLIHAESPFPGGSSASGLGDTTQSFFFSPKAPTSSGWIWGAGPAILFPTATEDALGGEKWGLGPTAVFLKQEAGWTYGALANHIWSVAGTNSRADISQTFIQPFLSFTTKTATTYTINTESIYDWKISHWTIPINLQVSQLVKFGTTPVSFALGYRNYVEKPAGGPDWGLSFTLTLLFPK